MCAICKQVNGGDYSKHPDAVIQPDGQIMLKRTDKNGAEVLESIAEREARLAHNCYMRFTRTFDSVSAS